MSFATETKDEICSLPLTPASAKAELCAMTLAASTASVHGGSFSITYTSENLAVAKRIIRIVRKILEFPSELGIRESALKKKRIYSVTIPDGPFLFESLGIQGNPFTGSLLASREELSNAHLLSLLRGAFLISGSISDPNKTYHLEFVAFQESFAELLQWALAEFEIEAKMIRRKDSFVIYLNEGDSIAALLALMGAHTSILNLENVRVLKETRNNVNRAVNCETANINKTVNAAQAQIRSIQVIEQKMGLEKLSAALREAALLRLEYPEATLQELCEHSGTTKSGMNHRLRKINAIAREVSGKEL